VLTSIIIVYLGSVVIVYLWGQRDLERVVA
jgi:hypothetical protein